jgi:hypothetical protein
MKRFVVLVFFLILTLSCSWEKTQYPKLEIIEKTTDTLALQTENKYAEIKNLFLVSEEDIKLRIFEKNINDTFKILRNNIFAKYGYKFNSADLHHYYSKKKWYKINQEYDHTLLTKDDSLLG